MAERIAKVMARAGICSRRDAEKLIISGKVKVDGKTIDSPALNVSSENKIEVDGKIIGNSEKTRLFIFHKPRGIITSHRDEKGRKTVFDILPKSLPRLISVGRLDFNTEGLLLLTNDGELSRKLELPSSKLKRVYRVRLFGIPEQKKFDGIKNGISIKGVDYGPVEAKIEGDIKPGKSQNFWAYFTISEGKNREIRRICEHFGFAVSRLIRVSYGPFSLGELKAGEITEIPYKMIVKKLNGIINEDNCRKT